MRSRLCAPCVCETICLLLFGLTELLHVDGMLHLQALQNRRLVELLTTAKLFHHACLLVFSLKLLECSFDVLTFFNRYDNHVLCFVFLMLNFMLFDLLRACCHDLRVQSYSYFAKQTSFCGKFLPYTRFFMLLNTFLREKRAIFRTFARRTNLLLPRTFTDRLGLYALARVLLIGICNPDALSISI